MKKHFLFIALLSAMVCFTACSGSPKKAKAVSNNFWSAVRLHHLDSIEILYPDFDKLHTPKSELRCWSIEEPEVIKMGNKCFEVRTNVKTGKKADDIMHIRSLSKGTKIEDIIFMTHAV